MGLDKLISAVAVIACIACCHWPVTAHYQCRSLGTGETYPRVPKLIDLDGRFLICRMKINTKEKTMSNNGSTMRLKI